MKVRDPYIRYLSLGCSTNKAAIGGWWDMCSEYNLVPSLNYAYSVSPKIGLKGLSCPVQRWSPATVKAMTCLNHSKGSFVLIASLRYKGANESESTIRYKVDQGSNIFTGNDICEIPRPLKKFFVSCVTMLFRTPFYQSIASSLTHHNPPWLQNSRSSNIASLEVGRKMFNSS